MSNHGTESHGSLRDSRVAKDGITGTGLPWLYSKVAIRFSFKEKALNDMRSTIINKILSLQYLLGKQIGKKNARGICIILEKSFTTLFGREMYRDKRMKQGKWYMCRERLALGPCWNVKCPHNLFWEKLKLRRIHVTARALEISNCCCLIREPWAPEEIEAVWGLPTAEIKRCEERAWRKISEKNHAAQLNWRMSFLHSRCNSND